MGKRQYVVKGIQSWLEGWKRKGWRKADGQPVINVELWQALDAQRPADPHLRRNDLSRRVGKPRELTGAACQNQPPARLRAKARRLQAIARELENFLHARTNDAGKLRFGNVMRLLGVFADLSDGQRLPIVRGRRDTAAV